MLRASIFISLKLLSAFDIKEIIIIVKTESSISEDMNNLNTDEMVVETENNDGEGDDDQVEFHADESIKQRQSVSPRWPTRVFAAQCVRKIITSCVNEKQSHFDLAQAKDLQTVKGKGINKIKYFIFKLS